MKEEMIEDIEMLIRANKDDDNCSIYWLADMIKEVIEKNIGFIYRIS